MDISESSADESESDIQKVRGHVKWPLVSPPCLNCWELIRTSISSQVVAGSYNEDTSQIHKNRITEINVKLPKGTRNPRHTATENIRPTLMTACDKRDRINTPPSTATHWVNLGSREQLACSIPGSAMIQHRTHHRAGRMTQRSPCADTPIRSQLAKNRQTFSIKLSKYTLIA